MNNLFLVVSFFILIFPLISLDCDNSTYFSIITKYANALSTTIEIVKKSNSGSEIYVCGVIDSEIFITKQSISTMETIWSKKYNFANAFIYDLLETTAGNLIIGARTNSANYVFKVLGTTGSISWYKEITNLVTSTVVHGRLIEKSIDNYILIHNSNAFGYGNNDITVINFSEIILPMIISFYQIGATSEDTMYGAEKLKNGNIIINSGNYADNKVFYVILDPSINIIAKKYIVSEIYYSVYPPLALNDGNFIINSNIVMKISADGNTIIWAKRYFEGNSSNIVMTELSNGNIIITYQQNMYTIGQKDILFVLTSPSGNLISAKTWGTTLEDIIGWNTRLVEVSDGIISFVNTQSTNPVIFNIFALKMDLNANGIYISSVVLNEVDYSQFTVTTWTAADKMAGFLQITFSTVFSSKSGTNIVLSKTIEQNNSNPTAITIPDQVIVPAISNSIVGTLTVQDDAGDSHTFSFTTCGTEGTDNSQFLLSSGQIKTNTGITIGVKSVRIKATDQKGLSYSQSFLIKVGYAPTDITLTNVNYNVGTLAATDSDVGDSHSFELVTGTGSSGNGNFQIIGNILKTAVGLNCNPSLSIRIRTTDISLITYEKIFSIFCCNSSCLDCSGDVNFCLNCNGNLLFYDNKCYSSCLDSTYTNGTHCLNCNSSCGNCFGNENNCTSCSNSLLYYEHSCYSDCLMGTYSNGSHCLPCNSSCGDCFGNENNCTTCTGGLLYYNNSCYTNCPSSTFTNTTHCLPCNSNCGDCFGNENNCSTCLGSSLYYNNFCYTNCPSSTFSNTTHCLPCNSSCGDCFGNENNCTTCTGGLLYYNNFCYTNCPSSTFTNTTHCLPCNSSCGDCFGNENNCTTCLPIKYIYQNKCFDYCPIGSFLNLTSSFICHPCNSSICQSCILNSNNCTQCIDGYFLMYFFLKWYFWIANINFYFK